MGIGFTQIAIDIIADNAILYFTVVLYYLRLTIIIKNVEIIIHKN